MAIVITRQLLNTTWHPFLGQASISVLNLHTPLSLNRGLRPTSVPLIPALIRKMSNDVSQEDKRVLCHRPHKHVASIELNRPKVKNAFDLTIAKQFCALLDELENDSSIRCVVLSGNGPDFTSGVDIKAFMSIYSRLQELNDVSRKAKALRGFIEQYQNPFKRLYSFMKPVICVHHGLALGLAMELAACSDIRFCTRDAKMSVREVKIGIAADVGSLQLLPTIISNQSLLNELIYTGRFIEPEEALNIGFVSRIYEKKKDAIQAAFELAQTIAQQSPLAVQGSKQNLRFSKDKSFLVGLDYNAVWNMAMLQGQDPVTAIGGIISKDLDVEFEDY